MADDLSDAFKEIRELKREVRRLQNARPLENSSVTNGRMRFVGGLLRVDSGGRVEIVGALQVDGATVATGTFRIEGPWTFTGNGTISGNVNITGTLTQNGTWVFNGNGTIAGDVNVTGGGKIVAGNLTISPASNGGSVKFSGGPEVYASGTELSLYSGGGGSFATLSPTMAKLNGPGARWFEVNSTTFRMVSLPTISRGSANNAVVGTVWADASGNLYRVVT